jgi:hypothetical protein
MNERRKEEGKNDRNKGSMGEWNQGNKKSRLTMLNLKLRKHFFEDSNIVFVAIRKADQEIWNSVDQ